MGRLALITAVASLFIACGGQSQRSAKPDTQNLEFVLDNNHNSLDLINDSESPVQFSFDINNRFPITDSIIRRAVLEIAEREKVHETEAAWMYVISTTYHAPPYSTENWQHLPQVFVGSIAGGLCDDQASTLAYVWKMFGYDVRVVGLTGHVVPEVFYNDKWQMFDPDENVYFRDSLGVVMSVNDIAANVHSSERLRDFVCSSRYYCPLSIDTALASYYLNLVATDSNNYDATEWHMRSLPSIDRLYQLPSNCSLKLVSDDGIHIRRALLKLSESSHGVIDLPFVAISISGSITANGQVLSGAVSNEHSLLPLNISACLPNTEIELIVNGKLRALNVESNSLSLSSSTPINISIGVTQKQPIYQDHYLFFDTITHFHHSDLRPIPVFSHGPNLLGQLSNHYNIFNEVTQCNGRDTITALQVSYDSLLSEFGPNFEELILANQPKSIHYLFLAHTYGQIHHARSLVNDNR